MKEFPGLSPAHIRKFALVEVNQLILLINQYRGTIRPIEISIDQIRRVLFSFFGVKEDSINNDAEFQKKIQSFGMGSTKLTEQQRIAWRKAGYPPLDKWLKDYGNDRIDNS